MKLHELLKSLMDEKGITAYELAKLSGLTRAGLHYLLSDETKQPNKKTLRLLSSVLGGNLSQDQHGNWICTADETMNGMRVVYRRPSGLEQTVAVFSDEFISGLGDIPEELKNLLRNDDWCRLRQITKEEITYLAGTIHWKNFRRVSPDLIDGLILAIRPSQEEEQKHA